MSLAPGTRLGPYEVLAPIGKGGMGEVYLAKDIRLGRSVAVKVLPAEFASDSERLARFEQEARAAAALNHPNIASVFDVGQQEIGGGEPVHYMVQELLEGQTLRERLGSKGAMPLKSGLVLAREIAEALTAAHSAGIVHRDLKPPNVFVSEDGHAKVLDFGLAKLTEPVGTGGAADSQSPTMVGTVAGQVMGTAGYMAPEQVEGERVDHRADLFAFGCVLYEIVTGQRAFAGKNTLDTLHRIANTEPPPLDEHDPQSPAELQRIVSKCLAKETSARYQSAADLAVDLTSLNADVAKGTTLPARSRAPAAAGTRRISGLALAASAVGLAVGALTVGLSRQDPPPEPSRLELVLPGGFTLEGGLTVAPDGRDVVFAARDADQKLGLYRRRLDDRATEFVAGSEGGLLPVYSPDGEWIVFSQGPSISSRLLKIPAEGGVPLELAQRGGPIYSSWLGSDRVVYEQGGTVFRVSSAGGQSQTQIAGSDSPRYDHPVALPGGRHVLLSVREDGKWSVGVLDVESGEVRTLVENARRPSHLPTGHLSFERDEGTIWAQAFDISALEVQDSPFPLQSGVAQYREASQFAVGTDGTMVFAPEDSEAVSSLAWVTTDGGVESASAPAPARIANPRLSPDEQYVAMTIDRDSGSERRIYTYDRRRSTFSRLRGLDDLSSNRPVWSRDGTWIYFKAAARGSDGDLFRAPADRSAGPERILERAGEQFPEGVSPDGRYLMFTNIESGKADLWLLPLEGGEPEPFLAEPHYEAYARFSPDGAWVAFVSDASDGRQIYYTPFPGPGPITKVSTGPSLTEPVWAKDGRRLFYFSTPHGALVAADAIPGSNLEFDAPRVVLGNRIVPPEGFTSYYDTARDGRLLMSTTGLRAIDGATRPNLAVVLNGFELLKDRSQER